MKTPQRYLITSALPYANGPLHIGHIAGAYLPADIYVRYLRQNKKDVAFICGSDEHGAAITLRAKKEGISPQEIVDKYHVLMQKAFQDFGMSFDIYHRTSSKLHHETASDFFTVLNNKKEFTIEESEQFFDEEAQQFLADRYVKGTCPKCAFDGAYGDQCEKCGSSLNPLELKNPVSTLSGKKPILKKTSHWYLPMQNHSHWVKEWIEKGTIKGEKHHNPTEWKKQVVGQCLSWIDAGLQPRAMTRDLDWGVKVPLPNADGKVLYVWLDAPIGYISATKQWAKDQGKNWEDYWKKDDTKLLHFIGKDNIVFHCIIFPMLLKAHGEFILPDNIPANEFLNLEGDKISTSRNWAVWLHEYLEQFPGKQDELRYVLCSIAPESKDSEFTWKDYQARVNNELVAIFGNFVNRTMVLTHKYYEGKVPALGKLEAIDETLLGELKAFPSRIGNFIEEYKFREAQAEMMNLARLGNKYLAETEPWILIKSNPERVKTILNISIQITANMITLIEPFLPFTSRKLEQQLNFKGVNWNATGGILIVDGHKLNVAELLYKKVEDADMEAQMQKLMESKKENSAGGSDAKPMKPNFTFDEFAKSDIRIGHILEAEKHPNADKLLVLKVDTGVEVRTIVSGIAAYYKPEEIVGKKVTLLANLEPRKIRGIESKGMILMAENSKGELSFISPEKDFEAGAEVR